MGYAKRVDATHRPIVDALRSLGWLVIDTSKAGRGFPDALAIKAGRVVFAEIKDGGKSASRRVLTKPQERVLFTLLEYGAEVVILESVEEAVAL